MDAYLCVGPWRHDREHMIHLTHLGNLNEIVGP